jgi:hypothetical protein
VKVLVRKYRLHSRSPWVCNLLSLLGMSSR